MSKSKPTSTPITAYKAFDADWKCRGFQYEVGKTYEHNGDIELCENGFHACEVPFDCWGYYEGSLTFARVSLDGESKRKDDGDSKIVAAKITIEASLSLPEWIKAQAGAVIALCAEAKKSLVGKDKECAAATGNWGHAAATGNWGHAAATGNWGHAAATGNWGHAAATGDSGHAAATGYSGHAAATGYRGHAAATGNRGHAAATGDMGHAAATGNWGHAAATGDMGHAAATGNRGHAAATGYRGHAAATGNRGHAAATGDMGHAAVEGENAVAVALGKFGTARAAKGSWIVLAAYDGDANIICVKTAKAGGEGGIKPDTYYGLNEVGEFVEVEE